MCAKSRVLVIGLVMLVCVNVCAMSGERKGEAPNALDVSFLPDGHVLKIDLSQPDEIPYDPRMGDKACAGLGWLAEKIKWGGAGIRYAGSVAETWFSRCHTRPQLQREFKMAQGIDSVSDSTFEAAQKLGFQERELRGVCFYLMQRLARGSDVDAGEPVPLVEDDRMRTHAVVEYGIKPRACESLALFHEGIKMGLYAAGSQDRAEIDLGLKACQVRDALDKSIDVQRAVLSYDWGSYTFEKETKWLLAKKNISLHHLDARIAYHVTELFKRLNHCQYALQPGYTLATSTPDAPFEKSTTAVDFLRSSLTRPYSVQMGNDACEGLQRLVAMVRERHSGPEVSNVGLQVCQKRVGWLAARNAVVDDEQQRERIDNKLLAADAVLAKYSSDSFSRFQEGLWCSSMAVDSELSALNARGLDAELAYRPELGDQACATLCDSGAVIKFSDTIAACKLRKRLLEAEPIKGAISAGGHTGVLRALRTFDGEAAAKAFQTLRHNGWYDHQAGFTGFCVRKP